MLLRTVTAASSVEGCSLVTRLQGNVQQTDFWNEFFAPPADMVHGAMQRWLADSGLCMAFLDPRGRSPADLVLEARLIALLGDETVPRAPAARIYLQTLLLDLDRVPKRMLARGDDNRRVPNSSLTPEVLAPPCRRRSRWCWPTSSMFCAASLRESSAALSARSSRRVGLRLRGRAEHGRQRKHGRFCTQEGGKGSELDAEPTGVIELGH